MTPAEELTFLRTLQRNIRYFEVMGRAPLGTEWLRLKVIARMAALALVVASGSAKAHDTWISRGNLKSPTGEMCCGVGDCGVFDDGAVKIHYTEWSDGSQPRSISELMAAEKRSWSEIIAEDDQRIREAIMGYDPKRFTGPKGFEKRRKELNSVVDLASRRASR